MSLKVRTLNLQIIFANPQSTNRNESHSTHLFAQITNNSEVI